MIELCDMSNYKIHREIDRRNSELRLDRPDDAYICKIRILTILA